MPTKKRISVSTYQETIIQLETEFNISQLRKDHNELRRLRKSKKKSSVTPEHMSHLESSFKIYKCYENVQSKLKKLLEKSEAVEQTTQKGSRTGDGNKEVVQEEHHQQQQQNILSHDEQEQHHESVSDDIVRSEEEDHRATDDNNPHLDGNTENDESREEEEMARGITFAECANCHRRQSRTLLEVYGVDSCYHIQFEEHALNSLKQRCKFQFFQGSRTDTSPIILCSECSRYFTENNNGDPWCIMWPGYFWSLITHHVIQRRRGCKMWMLLPTTMRHWWLESTKECNPRVYRDITIDTPEPIVMDKTTEINDMTQQIESGLLASLADSCDRYLMPLVLCPWGCTEYAFKAGHLPYDIVIRRYLLSYEMKTATHQSKIDRVINSRDDYLRFDDNETYETLLFNPKWKVMPSMCFVDGIGPPVTMTCRRHSEGSRQQYIHPPRQPHNNLPSACGDQLCHAVIRPRTIKPMKPLKYCTTFQMHEQRGSFQGLDTCDEVNVGDFTISSIILDASESRAIANRADINALLDQLCRENHLSSRAVEHRRSRAQELYPSADHVKKYWTGATYVPCKIAMSIQKQIGEEQKLEMIFDTPRNGVQPYTIRCRRNWPYHTSIVQKLDQGMYGSIFSSIPSFSNNKVDTRLIWIVSGVLVCVHDAWASTDSIKPLRHSQWHGWLLTYLSRQCFSGLNSTSDRKNFFKYSYITSTKKIMSKFVDPMTQEVFDNIEQIPLVFSQNKEIACAVNVNDVDEDDVNEDTTLIFICPNEFDGAADEIPVDGAELDDIICIKDDNYELRFIATTTLIWNPLRPTNYPWKGKIFCRHGSVHKSWWYQRRKDNHPLQTPNGTLDQFDLTDFNLAVYVKMEDADFEDLRNDMMKYMGGQIHCQCEEHRLPLIRSRRSNKRTCQVCNDKKESLSCPSMTCSAGICKSCASNLSIETITYVRGNVRGVDNNESDEEDTSEETDSDSESSNGSNNNNNGDDYYLGNPLEPEDLDDYVTTADPTMLLEDGDEDGYDIADIAAMILPSTNAGELAYVVDEITPKSNYVSGHVILNQVGSCLSRKNHRIKGYSDQQNFLQRICAISHGVSIPLLYAEAMIFTSIFWKLADCGAVVGAIPSCFLASNIARKYGVASIEDHIKSRLTLPFTSTSTDPKYVSFLYDMQVNEQLNYEDTRIVLNRGLTVAHDNDSSLTFRGKKDSSSYDSVEAKTTVRNLAASEKYHPKSHFLTYTCNQANHFGVAPIKKWTDSYEWHAYYPEFDNLKEFEKAEIRQALQQASAGLILRNWMEIRILFVDYLMYSPSSPFCHASTVFDRGEYQADAGNLPHAHIMIGIDETVMSVEEKERVSDMIRASIFDIVRKDEVQPLIDEGVFKSYEDVIDMQHLAEKILPHRCSPRCLCRISDGKGKESFRCRAPNLLQLTKDNTKHTYLPLPNTFSPQCVDRLIQIGMVEPITINEFGVPSKFKAHHPYFHPVRHIPPINPTNDMRISPVEGKTFAVCKSMQNVQSLSCTNGVNKYVCKYIGKIDEGNRVVIRAHPHKANNINIEQMFIHNSKVATSAINEKKAFSKSRDSNKATGRAICLMEMFQTMLAYPEVRTNMVFESIPTLPLENRAAIERTKRGTRYDEQQLQRADDPGDGEYLHCPPQSIRRHKSFPDWRLHRGSELLLLGGLFESPLSVDKITLFSVRPPELRPLVRKVGQYFRWFIIDKTTIKPNDLDSSKLDSNLRKCCWIDGLQHQIRLRSNAVDEIMMHVHGIDLATNHDDDNNSVAAMVSLFIHIEEAMNAEELGTLQDSPQFLQDLFRFARDELIHASTTKHLPVPVYSNIKSSLPFQFALHLLLSMGEFDTEVDLTLHRSLRDAFRYAKLIGPSDDEDELQEYSNILLRRLIVEQFVHYPLSNRAAGTYIEEAGQLLDDVIVQNEFPMSGMPPTHQTALLESIDEKINLSMAESKETIVEALLNEMISVSDRCNIPTREELMNADKVSPLDWNAIDNFSIGPGQNEESFLEQSLAVRHCVDAINSYCDVIQQRGLFVKCRIIHGAPGSGKSFLLSYIATYAISRGLRIGVSAMMARRSIHLGGLHIHKFFCLDVNNSKCSPLQMAENAIRNIARKPDRLVHLKTCDVLFLDEAGQIPAEMLSTIDFIMRKIRMSTTPFGGLLLIGTMDHTQLAPVKGRPFLMSSLLVNCFSMVRLVRSIRAANDPAWQRIQQLTRMHPRNFTNNPRLLTEFRELLSITCTFVRDWNAPEITANTHRIYGKRCPSNKASSEYVEQVKSKLPTYSFRSRCSDDVQNLQQSRREWQPASIATRNTLDLKVKEQRELIFFRGAIYEFTYNDPNKKFTQSQICLLIDLPSQTDLDSFRKIPVLVVPAGIHEITFDESKTIDDYISIGMRLEYVGVAPERIQLIDGNLQAQRKQYGIKHRYTSTIHKCMGDTLAKAAMEISLEGDRSLMWWDKAQVIVALSRTRYGKDTIFVGNQGETVRALTQLIQCRSQFTDYMECVLDLVTINTGNQHVDIASRVFNQERHFPFRICDIELPNCNTGFVYLLLSVRQNEFSYIGETQNITNRIVQHNRGFGAVATTPSRLRPFAVIAYICGFDGDKILRRHIERQWKIRRDALLMQGITCVQRIALEGHHVIGNVNVNSFDVRRDDLRLVLLYRDVEV